MNNINNKNDHFIPKIALLLTLLCISTAYAATEQKPYLYEGKIGNAPVVFELSIDQSKAVTGRYFYRKHSTDIALDGTQLNNGDIQLGENQDYDDQSKIDMILHSNKQGWQGEWIGHDPNKKKNIPIQLTPLRLSKTINYQLMYSTDYDQIRLSGLSLQKKALTRFSKYSLQWWKEPISQISFFRVISGYPKDTLARINTTLTTRHWQEVNSFFQCQFDGARRSGGEYEQTVTPRFMNDKIFSASVHTSYYCGGAHPDFGDNPINLDVKTGKELNLEDVLWISNATTTLKRNERGERLDYDYESKTLSPWVSRTMEKLYPQGGGSDKPHEDCDYRDTGVWTSPAFYFTPKGLHLAAYFARVARVCDNPDWAVLPWKIVNQHQGKLHLSLP